MSYGIEVETVVSVVKLLVTVASIVIPFIVSLF